MTPEELRLKISVAVAALTESLRADSDPRDEHVVRLRALLDGEQVANLTSLGPSEADGLMQQLIRDALRAGRRDALIAAAMPMPVYNFFAGFDGNQEPWDEPPEISQAVSAPDWLVFGRTIGAPIGVPASGLTANSKWIQYLSCRGWNLLTYTSVRSEKWPPHPFPNWLFAEASSHQISEEEAENCSAQFEASLDVWPKSRRSVTTVNSFGVPCPEPQEWQAEVRASLDSIKRANQILAVSVMGTPERYPETEALAQDYLRTALLAVETGADLIELNLSSPNNPGPNQAFGETVCNDLELVARCDGSVCSCLEK